MDVLDPPIWAGILALALAVAAGVGIVAMWLASAPRRVSPGEPTMELRDEPPALVDLLTGGFEVEDDAVPATAVDLALRGFYDIEEYGGGVVMRLRSGADDTGLTSYEQRVLRQVRNHAHDGIVPAAALTIGPEGVSERWFRGFVREVTKHGRSLGLCRRRFGFRHLAIAYTLVAVAVAPAWIVAWLAPRTDEPTTWGSIGNITLGLALLGGFAVLFLAGKVTRTDSQADTPAGREAAAHWLGVRDFYRDSGRFSDKPAASVAVWERHLAHATAMGLAPTVQRQLPFETEHDRHAWSRATGQWRRIKVRYQSLRPGWGQHPGRVAFEGLLRAVVFGVIAWFAVGVARADDELTSLDPDQREWVSLGAVIVAILAAVAAAYGLVRLVIGVADLFPRRTVEGDVVRRRRFRSGHRLPRPLQWMVWSGRNDHGMRRDQNRRVRYHLAVDDGTDDSVLAYTVRSAIHSRAPQGAKVRMRVSPLLGYVSDLEMLAPPPRSAAGEPDVLHPMVESGLATAGAAAGAKLDQLSEVAGDVTDDDGVTLDEHVRASREQIAKMLDDPRIANSPVGGIISAFGQAMGGATPDDPRPDADPPTDPSPRS